MLCGTLRKSSPSQKNPMVIHGARQKHRGLRLLFLPKYSNGGCSGFEPDSLFIYSVYNYFSNRIFHVLLIFKYYTKNFKLLQEKKPTCFIKIYKILFTI